jgi:hypothetical protein
MLRRSHDHHRGLRARLHATASANSSSEPRQDRHLMIMSQPGKSAGRARWLSTGHDRAHQMTATSPKSSDKSWNSMPCAHSSAAQPSNNSLRRRVPNQPARPRQPNPIAPAAPPYVPSPAVSSLEAFGRRPPNTRRRPSRGRHPKPFTAAEVRASASAARSSPKNGYQLSRKHSALQRSSRRADLARSCRALVRRRHAIDPSHARNPRGECAVDRE